MRGVTSLRNMSTRRLLAVIAGAAGVIGGGTAIAVAGGDGPVPPAKPPRFSIPSPSPSGRAEAHEGGVGLYPQSLWISLWAASGLDLQVALPQGFFLFRSIFERNLFSLEHQGLRNSFRCQAACCAHCREMATFSPCSGG